MHLLCAPALAVPVITESEQVIASQNPVTVPLQAILCSMELAKFGKVTKKKRLLKRVEQLERKVYEHEYYQLKRKDFNQRISDLVEKLKPTQEQLENGFQIYEKRFIERYKPNWLLNPPEIMDEQIGSGN